MVAAGKGLLYWINKEGPIDTYPRNKKEFNKLFGKKKALEYVSNLDRILDRKIHGNNS